jgi:enoyl-CoA hydratase/carnithine racemase
VKQFVYLKKPLYFYVNGCGVGFLAATSVFADFVYMTEDAFLMLPFMSLLLCPEGGSSIVLPQIVGKRKANEMIYLESRVYAKEAVDYNLATGIIQRGQEPPTEPIITEISKLPNMEKLLSIDTETLQ